MNAFAGEGIGETIRPDWPAPERVRAASTTRAGGASDGAWASFNLGEHVGDDPAAVAQNRARLRSALALPDEPRWLRQRHTTKVVRADANTATVEADGSVTQAPGVVCAVLTADCLPVLLCDRDATMVAALHAGWRGLAAGVIEAGVRATGVPPGELLAWLGPAIGPERYEVGDDVPAAVCAADPDARAAFRPSPTGAGKWQADLGALARRRLARAGVPPDAVHGGEWCTASDPERFFSYRRDGVTGRMATLIWLE